MFFNHPRRRAPLLGPANAQRAGGRRRSRRRQTFTSKVRKIVDRHKEKKYANLSFTTTIPVAGSSEVIFLTGIAEGDTELKRDGQETYLHSIHIRIRIASDTDAITATVYRILLVRASHNIEGILPTVNEILESDTINDFPK